MKAWKIFQTSFQGEFSHSLGTLSFRNISHNSTLAGKFRQPYQDYATVCITESLRGDFRLASFRQTAPPFGELVKSQAYGDNDPQGRN